MDEEGQRRVDRRGPHQRDRQHADFEDCVRISVGPPPVIGVLAGSLGMPLRQRHKVVTGAIPGRLKHPGPQRRLDIHVSEGLLQSGFCLLHFFLGLGRDRSVNAPCQPSDRGEPNPNGTHGNLKRIQTPDAQQQK